MGWSAGGEAEVRTGRVKEERARRDKGDCTCGWMVKKGRGR